MISGKSFCQFLEQQKINFFCGVPDSLLKNLCAFIDQKYSKEKHVITANEGNAVGMAMGHYLGTGTPAMVYMQNSGLGNAINPLISMASKEVSRIPMLLVIGWRGEPGVSDEPQHLMQGRVTPEILTLMEIPFIIVDKDTVIERACRPLFEIMAAENKPVAILVRKGTFAAETSVKSSDSDGLMSREFALEVLYCASDKDDLMVATTGKTARELYELQIKYDGHCKAFLTIGAMGHASGIAMGVSLSQPGRRVFCLDGDGSVLMHMGTLAINGQVSCNNFIHVVLNNAAHESVGGQPTVAMDINLPGIAKNVGYQNIVVIDDEESLDEFIKKVGTFQGSVFVMIKIATGSRANLGRPQETPEFNKNSFMQHIKQ